MSRGISALNDGADCHTGYMMEVKQLGEGHAETGRLRRRLAIERASFASMIGTTIERYDFYLFVFCSALVFPNFFTAADPVSGYIGSIGTLVAAFVSRPLGHFGDT